MFILKWYEPDSGNSVDVLDPSMFAKNAAIVEHDTRWDSSGGKVIARASVKVDDRTAIVDYGSGHEEWNEDHEVDRDVLRLKFADADRTVLMSVEIMDQGEFRPAKVEVFDTAVLNFEEGENSLIPHFRRERSQRLITLKLLESGSDRCAVCAATMVDRYGSYAPSFDVHHRDPIAKGPTQNGTSALAVLCPNCHRAIHKTKPMMDVPQFRKWFEDYHR